MIDEAYNHAVKILKECICDIGFKASALDDGYHEVWGRDSMITLLGAIASQETDLIVAARNSLDTLARYQTELGLIPNNVDVGNNEPQYRAYMDGTMWYIIGSYAYFKHTRDLAFLEKHVANISKALTWLRYQDVDATGLISTQEACDWMDLFPVRGKVLYDNMLYYGALNAAQKIYEVLGDNLSRENCIERAKRVYLMSQAIFWIHKSYKDAYANINAKITELSNSIKNMRYLEDEIIRVAQRSANLVWRPYFLPFIGFRQSGDWFDTLANILAILFGVSDEIQTKLILDFASQAGVDNPGPAKAVYPPIYPGEREWRDYFKHGNLNIPNQYHNGGIWPFIGGFYVAALVKHGQMTKAQTALQNLAEVNRKGKQYEWGFNEWLHGQTGNPMGKEKQAWSAAMYIFAYNSMKKGNADIF